MEKTALLPTSMTKQEHLTRQQVVKGTEILSDIVCQYDEAGNLYDSYVKVGEVISWKNATYLITLGLSIAGMGMAGKSLAKDGKALKAVSQGNVNVKPAAVSNSTASGGGELYPLYRKKRMLVYFQS